MAELLSGPNPALFLGVKKNEAGKYVPVLAAVIPVRMRAWRQSIFSKSLSSDQLL